MLRIIVRLHHEVPLKEFFLYQRKSYSVSQVYGLHTVFYEIFGKVRPILLFLHLYRKHRLSFYEIIKSVLKDLIKCK